MKQIDLPEGINVFEDKNGSFTVQIDPDYLESFCQKKLEAALPKAEEREMLIHTLAKKVERAIAILENEMQIDMDARSSALEVLTSD